MTKQVPPALTKALDALEANALPYMLTGSVAAAGHGYIRATEDIDFVLEAAEPDLLRFVRQLEADGWVVSEDAAREAHRMASMFNAIDPTTLWKVDFIIRKERPFSLEEFARRAPMDLAGRQVFAVTLEDSVISKMEWAHLSGSARQIEDVGRTLRLNPGRWDEQYVLSWVQRLGLQREWSAVLAQLEREPPSR